MSQAHITLVDDDPTQRALVSALLAREGWESSAHPTAEDLLRSLPHRLPDLFLLDLNQLA